MFKFVVLAACLVAANASALPGGISSLAIGSPWASGLALGGPTIIKSAPILAPAPIISAGPVWGSPVIKGGLSPLGLGGVVSPIGLGGVGVIKSPLGLGAW